MTWTRNGESSEFAHFTDRQIAMGLLATATRGQISLAEATAAVTAIRLKRGNLSAACKGFGVSKPELADALWPTLESKIRSALARQTARRIPIVRVISRATHLANEPPRRNLVLALNDPSPTASTRTVSSAGRAGDF